MIILHYGIQRSGNHGFLNWVKELINHKYVHINNLLQPFSFEHFNKWMGVNVTKKNIDEKWTGLKGSENVIISFENQYIDVPVIEKIKSVYGDVKLFVLLRNPYNNIASACKFYKCENYPKLLIRFWIYYANLHLNPADIENIDHFLNIYDEWIENKQYREKIAKFLDKSYTEKNLSVISGWGQSSFNKNAKTTEVSSLKSRYESMKNDQVYIKLIKDKEIITLWEKIIIKNNINVTKNESDFIKFLNN